MKTPVRKWVRLCAGVGMFLVIGVQHVGARDASAMPAVVVTLRPGGELTARPDGRDGLGRAGIADEQVSGLLDEFGARRIVPVFVRPFGDPALARSLGMDRMYRVELRHGADAPALAALLPERCGNIVEHAEADGPVTIASEPNDVYFPTAQWNLRNTGQTIGGQQGVPGADIDAPGAWAISTGRAAVRIAILDTGISPTHPDLLGKLVGGRNFTGDNPDDWGDRHGHGTHVAAIAGARTNNSAGVAGVCWECGLLAVKVLGDGGSGQWSWLAAGVQWAADQPGVRVISMSLGAGTGDGAAEAAIHYAWARNIIVVAAAGNTYGGPVTFPGRYPNTICVAATDNRDLRANIGSMGAEIDLAAPGKNIFSCQNSPSNPDGYAFLSGTSMATPHVAGLAALLVSIDPQLGNTRARGLLRAAADDRGPPGFDTGLGHGRINARRSAEFALGRTCPADFNFSGQVDFFDYLDFVIAYQTNDPIADFNGSGSIDFFDYLDFILAFGAECP